MLETRSYLTGQLAQDLQGASTRVERRPRGGFDADGDGRGAAPRARPAPPGAATCSCLALTPDGSVATDAAGVEQNAVVNDQGADDVLTARRSREVARGRDEPESRRGSTSAATSAATSSRPRSSQDGTRSIVGVSTAPVDELQAQLLGVVVGGTAIGLVLVGLGGTVLIRRSLAPARPGGRHGPPGLRPQARLGPGGPRRAGARRGRRRATPRSARSASRSTRCSTTSSRPCTPARRARRRCASSSPTPATSCAPRWRRSAATPS